jgi:hypothetical protein
MGDMAVDGLWNWAADARLEPAAVRAAIAAELGVSVCELGFSGGERSADASEGAVLVDVWHVGGDYPTLIDCYLVPAAISEADVAAAVAIRLRAAVLLPDDSLNPTRYVRIEPDSRRTTVHVDETETDDGPERRHTRPCTGHDPACAVAPEQHAA